MFLLILLWLLIGLCLGLLALAAGFYAQLRYRWLLLLLIGLLSAPVSGLLGLLLLGKDVATTLTLWLPIVALLSIPRLFSRAQNGRRA